MKTISIELDVEDDEETQIVDWLKRELLTEHPWIPGALLSYVKNIRISVSKLGNT